jgi:serine/threonine protein phosphatase 1
MITFAIGDIHGGLRALEQLLSRINPQDDDTFIFLGDYVDGWSESAQVIDYLIDMSDKHKCFFIKGNHDVWCEEWLHLGKINETWYKHGGEETIKSYSNFTQNQKNNHLEFFERMRFYYVEHGKLFVHAGFTSIHGVFNEDYPLTLCWDRTLWEMVCAMDKTIKPESIFYPKRLLKYKEIYIGHTPTIFSDKTFDKPLNFANVWNIDTGSAFTGKLSAINIDTKEVFQSDVVQSLYPDEKGRN